MKKHYLILQRMPMGHTYVDFAYAETPLAAIQNYLTSENDYLTINEDGSVTCEFVGKQNVLHYPHPLAFIEAHDKQHHEWQIRELPDWVLVAKHSEGVCGEDAGWIHTYIDDCLPHFRRQFPRVRVRAFIWYLRDGVLVTFYRRKNNFQIEVLQRFLYGSVGNEWFIRPWEGSYEDLLSQLSLMPEVWETTSTGVQ